MKKIIYSLLILFSINCSPLLQSPTLELPEEYAYGEGFSSDSISIDTEWWRIFGDSTLNRLVSTALNNNRDLAAMVAKVESARGYVKVAKAELLPSLSMDAEVEAYRINGTTTKELSATPTITWELSLFGKLRNTRKSATSEYLASEWGYSAAKLSLSAEVVTTLFTLAQYQRSLEIATRSYELRVEATALVDSMYRYGMSNGIALEQARSLVYSAESEIASYRRALEQTHLALNLLLGEPVAQGDCSLTLLDNTPPPTIPIGLPSSLVERRPDIVESYHNMQSAAAKVGIARAERFPSISLTAEGGFITETLKDLTSAKPFGWSFIGELTQPIFNFGALKNREKMANQTYLAAMYDYEQATLTALKDVEQSLVYISTYRAQLLSAKSLMVANTKIAHTTSALYKSGMGNYLSVIDAERELYTSQIDFLAIATQQYLNYINLVKALGGSF